MAKKFASTRGLSVIQGGGGERLVVLLHGLGAHRGVWERMLAIAGEHWQGRWMAPDLRGHGRSMKDGPFGYGIHAADIADLIEGEPDGNVTLIGHSFGGVVAALAGSGWFGRCPREVAAFGVKIVWTAEETAKAQEMATRPARAFATREEAIDRALKLAGLHGLVDPRSDVAAASAIESNVQWQAAMDPRVYGAVGPSVEEVLRLCSTELRLAAGENDPMVTLDQMRAIDAGARVFAGAGHNVHWEAPAAVWDFVNKKC